MKKLSILKKELFYNFGLGVSNLILGIVSYLNVPIIISLIITCFSFVAIFFALIPIFAKADAEDELSENIRNDSANTTLKLGLVVLIFVSVILRFEPISQIVYKEGFIEFVIAFFLFFYSITYIVKTKKIDESKDFFEEN